MIGLVLPYESVKFLKDQGRLKKLDTLLGKIYKDKEQAKLYFK
jgi:hypothetical protein